MARRVLAAASVVGLCVLVSAGPAWAQFSYNFNSLVNSDLEPYPNLNGQDGWVAQGLLGYDPVPPSSWVMGVTATAGFDGTPCLRFRLSGGGVAAEASHKRSPSFLIPRVIGQEPRIVLQGDFRGGDWGNILRFAADTNNDGTITYTQPGTPWGEMGPGLYIGASDAIGICVFSATGTQSHVTLPSLGIDYFDWLRVRLEIDPQNRGQGVGRVSYQDLDRGDTSMQPIAALQNVNMEFNWSATGVTNPSLWDAVYIQLVGSNNRFDNLYLAADGAPIPAAGPFGLALLAALLIVAGVVVLRLRQ